MTEPKLLIEQDEGGTFWIVSDPDHAHTYVAHEHSLEKARTTAQEILSRLKAGLHREVIE